MATVLLLSAVYAQTPPPGATLPATAIGIASVFIAFLQYLVWVLWKDNRLKDTQYVAVMERVLPALTKSADAHAETARTIAAFNERIPTHEEITQLRRALAASSRRRD